MSVLTSMAPAIALDSASHPRALFGRQVHLLGVLGSGMKNLAALLVDAGLSVSGSDAVPLAGCSTLPAGVRFHPDPADRPALAAADCLIYSAAIPADHPARVAAKALGIDAFSYPTALGRLSQQVATVAVAGTHGKSTTAAVISHLLHAAGRDPTYCFGATYANGAPGGRYGQGGLAVLEACEFRRHFLELRPQVGVVTNIDQDHLDCYDNNQAIVAAFQQFLAGVSADGPCIVSQSAAASLAEHDRLETFAIADSSPGSPADWLASDLALHAQGSSFRLWHRGHRVGDFHWPLLGRHNVENAVAAIATAVALGLSVGDIGQYLPAFPGLQRRLAVVARQDGLLHYDDFAHHPTAIRATLATLRQCHPGRRLIVLFQPHQAGRTQQLFGEFVSALAAADAVAVLEVYRAREPADLWPDIAVQLAQALRSQGTTILPGSTWSEAWPTCVTACRQGDVLVTMSAGSV